MDRWRQRAVSFVSAAIFLTFLWLLFQKLVIVAWISISWWMVPLLLVGLFFFIETVVAKTFRAKEPVVRVSEKVKAVSTEASEKIASSSEDALQAVKDRLADRERRNAKP